MGACAITTTPSKPQGPRLRIHPARFSPLWFLSRLPARLREEGMESSVSITQCFGQSMGTTGFGSCSKGISQFTVHTVSVWHGHSGLIV